MVNTEIRLIIFFAAKDGEALYSQQKQDQELTVAHHEIFITKYRFKLKKVGKTTRPFRYDINQNDYFWTSYPNSRCMKHVSLQFQSCVNAFLGYNVLSVNVDFCMCFYQDQLQLYCQRTSNQETARRVFLSENTQVLDKTSGHKEGKHAALCFFHQAGDCNYSRIFR